MQTASDRPIKYNSILFDNRAFKTSPKDLKSVCTFFNIGKLIDSKKEDNIKISHSNFIYFIRTTKGRYVIKFYPSGYEESINTELILNRLMRKNKLPTPFMHISRSKHPFLATSRHLAVCFDLIDGDPAYEKKLTPLFIKKLNKGLFHIKDVLAKNHQLHHLLKKTDLSKTIQTLVNDSKKFSPYKHENIINQTLTNAYKTYNNNRPLFTQAPLHPNLSLCNLLFYKNDIFFLDLGHIRIDYSLNDLANVVASCLIFETPQETIQALIQNYFLVHKTSPEHLPALTALVSMELSGVFLKTELRMQRVKLMNNNTSHIKTYLRAGKKYQGVIASQLKMLSALKNLAPHL